MLEYIFKNYMGHVKFTFMWVVYGEQNLRGFNIFFLFRNAVFDQKSPVHPVSESKEGCQSVTHQAGGEASNNNYPL